MNGETRVERIDTPFTADHPVLGKVRAAFSWTERGLLLTMLSDIGNQQEIWYFPKNSPEELHKSISFQSAESVKTAESEGKKERVNVIREYALVKNKDVKLPKSTGDCIDSTRLSEDAKAHMSNPHAPTALLKTFKKVDQDAPGSLARYGNIDELKAAMRLDAAITGSGDRGLRVKADGFGKDSITITISEAGEYNIPAGTLVTTGSGDCSGTRRKCCSHTSNVVVTEGWTGYARKGRTVKLSSFGCDGNYRKPSLKERARITQLRFKTEVSPTALQWYHKIKQTFPNADREWRMFNEL